MELQMNLIGKIVRVEGLRYRVIWFAQNTYVFCQMDITRLIFTYYPAEQLKQQIRNGDIKIEEESLVWVVDEQSLSLNEQKRFAKRKKIVSSAVDKLGPSYSKIIDRQCAKEVEEIAQQFQISKVSFWNYMRRYLQSGFNESSLIDGRFCKDKETETKKYIYKSKTGRPKENGIVSGVILNDEVIAQFNSALNEFKKGREKSYKNAYLWLLDRYYSYDPENGTGIMRLKPISEIPTYQQFAYYCRNHITQKELDILKTSAAEQRNLKRLLLGSVRTDAIRPGWIVEADALEADFSIVSDLNHDQSIGRPIVYMMIDLYSSAIVAASVSLENNSMLGLTGLMLNLADDKKAYCKEYGIELQENLWPSNFIPHEIRCDRGSDFKSDKFSTICKRLGITRTLESGGMGSLKGLIEQSFHQFQTQLRPELENKGLITQRYDSNHHRQAMLSLADFIKLVINFIVTHNMRMIEDYPMRKEMYEDENFVPAPIYIWQYGCKKHGLPRMVTPAMRNQFIYDLMEERQAKLSRKGLKLNNLFYLCPNDSDLIVQMYRLGNKTQNFTVRFDARCMGKIYYMRNHQIFTGELNTGIPGNADFANMTLQQYEVYRQKRKEINFKSELHNVELDYSRYQINKGIIASAEKSNLSDTKQLRAARSLERQFINGKNKIEDRFDKNTKDISSVVKQENNDNPAAPRQDSFEAFDDLSEALEKFNREAVES